MRIISLSPAVTEILVKLGLEDEIVGTSSFCLLWLTEKKEIVGSYISISYSKLKELKPDIVFLQSGVQDRIFRALIDKGYRAYLMPLPRSIYGILQSITDVGSIVGRYYDSKELISRLLEKLDHLRVNLSMPPKGRLKVYVEYLWPNWSYTTAGALTFIDDGIWWAGGINIFHERVVGFFTPKTQEILCKKPQLILVNIEPVMKISLPVYLKRRGFEKVKKILLVKESRDINLAHPGPSFINTVLWLSKLLKNTYLGK